MTRLQWANDRRAIQMDAFNEALRGWQNFYFMMGGAAATLAGLMFVALSLALHLINDRTRDQMRIFATPSIIYFVSVLLIAGTMLIPILTPEWLTLLAFVCGGIGTARAAYVALRLAEAARHYSDFTV